MKKKEKANLIKFAALLVVIVIFSFMGYEIKITSNGNVNIESKNDVESQALKEVNSENSNTNIESKNENLKIHYVDVGQGDSAIIEKNGHFMLIDAGPKECENSLIEYIDSLQIEKFDYVIATHAHEDHIGSMSKVIDKYDIGKVLFAKHTTTTTTFKNFVTSVKNKGLKLYAPNVGEEFSFEDTSFTVLGPVSSSYDDLNNYSIVIKLKYGSTSYLFTGDAESLSEKEILNKGLDVSADVLKVGHHGSNSSTSKSFLDAVNPKYAIISCGKNNDYGHPKKKIMDRIKNKNIKVYRTDESGTITLTSDGKNISFDKEEGTYNGY